MMRPATRIRTARYRRGALEARTNRPGTSSNASVIARIPAQQLSDRPCDSRMRDEDVEHRLARPQLGDERFARSRSKRGI